MNFLKYIFNACKSQNVLNWFHLKFITHFTLGIQTRVLHKESKHVSHKPGFPPSSEQNNSYNENNFIASH